MTHSLITGLMSQLESPQDEWVFIDLGFSQNTESTGYAHDRAGETSEPWKMFYGTACSALYDLASKFGPPLHLVLEAPLSTSFDQFGNPHGRKGEKRGRDHRYWNNGLGCGVLVAALYMLNGLNKCPMQREVRLFEGMASFKQVKSSHQQDVEDLRRVVWSRGKEGGRFIPGEPISPDAHCSIESILSLLGLDPAPPPIVEVIHEPIEITAASH